LLLVLLPLALLAGGAVERWTAQDELAEPVAGSGEMRNSEEAFTNPLLECEAYGSETVRALKPFKYKVEQLLQSYIDTGRLIEGAVYFRSLKNGMWFGINQELTFHPSSLLKVPIMIACLKAAERDPRLLEQQIVYRGDVEPAKLQGYQPSRHLEPGKAYTVNELLDRMITLSDNNATYLLVNLIGEQRLDKVLRDLNVDLQPKDEEHIITAHTYSGFFRVLYNASYLNHENSEKALELLSRSEFADGLRAGLPPEQMIASKFGERGLGPEQDVVQMHEFGIVYYPGRPYLLGVMTRAHRDTDFLPLLSEISQLVYQEVSSQTFTATDPKPPAW